MTDGNAVDGRLDGVLAEDARRITDRDARSFNIATGRAVADVVRSTLGPKGMDKMLIDDKGGVTITNDGVTILREMAIHNATGEMLVEVADTQEEDVGDGTTTAVVLAGALLARAEALIDRGVHPASIMEGFRIAAEHALDEIEGRAESIDTDDRDRLRRVAETSLAGTKSSVRREEVAEHVVEAVTRAHERGRLEDDLVSVETWKDEAVDRVVDGIVMRKDPVHEAMPESVEDASVLVIDDDLELRFEHKEELDEEVVARVEGYDDIERFREMEDERFDAWVERIVDLGADAVFTTEHVDERVAHRLARQGVFAVGNVIDEDVERLPAVTGATVTDLENASESDLGSADLEYHEGVESIVVQSGGSPHTTVLVRDRDIAYRKEFERTVEDAIDVVSRSLIDGTVVAGGGAIELALARSVDSLADSVPGREQLAVEAFADALEVVPTTLARNAGLDPIDTLVDLRAAHDSGRSDAGIDADARGIESMWERGVIEPAGAKTRAIGSAVEGANRLLKIDDVIGARGFSTAEKEERDPIEDPMAEAY